MITLFELFKKITFYKVPPSETLNLQKKLTANGVPNYICSKAAHHPEAVGVDEHNNIFTLTFRTLKNNLFSNLRTVPLPSDPVHGLNTTGQVITGGLHAKETFQEIVKFKQFSEINNEVKEIMATNLLLFINQPILKKCSMVANQQEIRALQSLRQDLGEPFMIPEDVAIGTYLWSTSLPTYETAIIGLEHAKIYYFEERAVKNITKERQAILDERFNNLSIILQLVKKHGNTFGYDNENKFKFDFFLNYNKQPFNTIKDQINYTRDIEKSVKITPVDEDDLD